ALHARSISSSNLCFRRRTTMRKLLSFALAFVTFVCLCAPTQFIVGSHAQSDAQTAQRLADRAIGQTPLMNDLRELCDQIGGRPTGSPACERAVEWGAAKFRAAGVDDVRIEPFTVPNLWLGETAAAECIAPEHFN